MNTVKARCGHEVPAVGAWNSAARAAQLKRTCGSPRCDSGLPDKFTDRECAAYVWMWDRKPWFVDLKTKQVTSYSRNGNVATFENLIEFAKAFGWEG